MKAFELLHRISTQLQFDFCKMASTFDCKPCSNENFDDTSRRASRECNEITPMKTPAKSSSRIAEIQRQLEEQIISSCQRKRFSNEISPTLAKLRNTPASSVAKHRKDLAIRHNSISKRLNQLDINGGVCLWPQMAPMQFTSMDILFLIGQAAIICVLTVGILIKFHGETFKDLQKYTSEMKTFCDNYQINSEAGISPVADQISRWHRTFLHRTEKLQYRFDLSSGSAGYFAYMLCYVIGFCCLFFYLIDSVRSRNRFSLPHIKFWFGLFTVICSWTVVISVGLFQAYQLELQIIHCIQQYSLSVDKVGSSSTDLASHQSVLLYWKSRFLDYTARGLLHICGPITVKDLVSYLAYYSIPILTVILGPLLKMFICLWQSYIGQSITQE